VVNFIPWPLDPWERNPQYPLYRRVHGPRIELDNAEKRKFFTLLGLQPLLSIVQTIASCSTGPKTKIKYLKII
jgi:hypothetical protein